MLRRAASAVMAVLLVVLSLATFAVTVAGGNHEHTSHSHSPATPATATPDHRAAADKLVKDVKAALSRRISTQRPQPGTSRRHPTGSCAGGRRTFTSGP